MGTQCIEIITFYERAQVHALNGLTVPDHICRVFMTGKCGSPDGFRSNFARAQASDYYYGRWLGTEPCCLLVIT
jgi:hypothetical protein